MKQKANDIDWTVRSLMKMSDMAKNEGNAAEAEAFRNQANDLKNAQMSLRAERGRRG